MTAATPPLLQVAPPPLPAAAPVVLAPWSDASIGLVTTTKPTILKTDDPAVKSLPAQDEAVAIGPVQPPPLPAGEHGSIGPYRLHQLIGEGGMGLVYRAEDALLKRAVALKVMKPDMAQDERAWRLFLTEAQATAALKDDRIATIYQVGEEHGQFYLAMELLQGESLESRLRRGPVSLSLALWVVRETALGLAVAHTAGFVHRDIKPANLWLETTAAGAPTADPLRRFREELGGETTEAAYRRVKILDFGLVRLGQDEDLRRRSAVGTPAYMAPEQAVGSISEPRSDIFSLGVVLFRMLTGRMPFSGNTTIEVLTALANETPPPVTKYNPQIPPPLVSLVARMLSRDPSGRPITAAELAREIEAIERKLNAPPPPPRSRRNMLLIGGILGLSVVAFAAAWFILNYRSTPTDVPSMTTAPANAVLTAAEAAHAIGDQVTVEFEVGVVKRGDQVYVYEAEPAGDELTFRVVVPGHIISTMRKRGFAWPDALQGAKVRLHGLVTREGRFAEILVADVEQLDKITYRDNPEAANKPKGKPGRALPRDPAEDPDDRATFGRDLPPTTGPSQRIPDPRQGWEQSQEVQRAMREMMEKYFGKMGIDPNAIPNPKSPPKPLTPRR